MPSYYWDYRGVDIANDTLKIALVDNDYVPSPLHHWSDAEPYEISGTGYTAGGEELTNVVITTTGGNLSFTSDGVSWTALEATNIRWAILYQDTGTPATSVLIAYMDLMGPHSPDAADCAIDPHGNGWDVRRYEF